MPLEGHWKRTQTPLRSTTKREGRLLVVVVAVLVIALAAVVYAAAQSGSSAAGPGCINVAATHSTGGATLHACGASAARWCRSASARHDALARGVQAECRRVGIPLAAGNPGRRSR